MKGTVRIACSEVVAVYLMPQVVVALRRQHAQIQVELVSSNAVSNLLRRDADVALRLVRPNQSSLVARKIAAMPMGAFAAPEYLIGRTSPSTAGDLHPHELIGLDNDDTLIHALSTAGVAVGRDSFSVRTDDQVAGIRLVQAGRALGSCLAKWQPRSEGSKPCWRGCLQWLSRCGSQWTAKLGVVPSCAPCTIFSPRTFRIVWPLSLARAAETRLCAQPSQRARLWTTGEPWIYRRPTTVAMLSGTCRLARMFLSVACPISGFAPRDLSTFRDQSASIAPKQHFLSVDLTVKGRGLRNFPFTLKSERQ